MIAKQDSIDNLKPARKEPNFIIREEEPEKKLKIFPFPQSVTTNFTSTKTHSYGCDLCDFQSIDKFKVTNHKDTQHDYDIFNCDQCDFRAYYQNHVRDHIMFKHGNIKYKCKKCKYEANCQSDLLDHNISNSHWNEDDDKHTDEDEDKVLFEIKETINQSDEEHLLIINEQRLR